jgi:Cyclic nucleotide-binding domain
MSRPSPPLEIFSPEPRWRKEDIMIEPQLFQEIPFFSKLKKQDLQAMAQVAQLKDYPSGSILEEPGENPQSLNFILSGEVKEIRKMRGRPPIVRHLREGEVLGGDCLLGKTSPYQEIVALTNTKVVEIGKKDFLTAMRGHPEILLAILQESALVQPLEEERQPPEFNPTLTDVDHLEKLITSELESIKLRYEALEKQATSTMEIVEKHSHETMEQMEKHVDMVIEESKRQLETQQELVDKATAEMKSSTSAALNNVQTFWKQVTRVVTVIIAITGIGGVLTIPKLLNEIKNINEVAQKAKEVETNANDVKQIKENAKKEVDKALKEFYESTLRIAKVEDRYKALEASTTAIHSEIEVINLWNALPPQLKDKSKESTLDSIKYLNANMTVNRIKILEYFRDYMRGKLTAEPESLVEAVNVFLRLSWHSKEKIRSKNPYSTVSQDSGDERMLVWSCCHQCLQEFKIKYSDDKQPRDWRFNAIARDNLVLFGKIMKDDDPQYYAYEILPDLKRFVKDTDLHIYAKRAVAQAMAMLWESDKKASQVLLDMPKDEKGIWAQCQAAACLLRLMEPSAYTAMAELMDKVGWQGLIAAQFAGEVLLEQESFRLDQKKLNPENVFNIIQKRMSEGTENINYFRRLYAEMLQEELKKKYKF